MTKTKSLLLAFFLFGLFIFDVQAEAPVGKKQTFTITGYYSPLPNQNFYVTGSYEGDITLNGKGIRGADFTPVYPGMIAAPSTYAFGTKICIPGFGCGAVHDRGGAIVTKGKRDVAKHDRLDLWMGYGDEGLIRALAYGVQHLECDVYSEDAPIKESVNFHVPQALYQVLTLPERKVFEKNLSFGSTGDEVKTLQQVLQDMGFFTAEVTGTFGQETEAAVFEFQKKYFVVEDENTLGAGIFGPQTRETMTDEYQHFCIQRQIQEMWNRFHFDENMQRGVRNEAALKLQEILVKEEFLEVSPTGFFGPQTEDALKEFQVARGIIEDEMEFGAGLVGPLTRAELNKILDTKKNDDAQEKKQIMAYTSSHQRLQYLASQNFFIEDTLVYGDEGDEVSKIQEVLYELGYLDVEPTGFFGQKTKLAVKQFQVDHGVVKSYYDRFAGTFGPSTFQALKTKLTQG